MSEEEAVKKSLMLCGFIDVTSSFIHQVHKHVYIPEKQARTFYLAIKYFNYYSFNRIVSREEGVIFYRTARRLEKYERIWYETKELHEY